MPKYYPIYLDIDNKNCVVIGGGNVAYRKACGLKESGGSVTVISPEFCEDFLSEKNITLKKKKYEESDISQAVIVIASTDNESVNKQVYIDATKINIPVNIVDQPELCSFIVPSIIKSGDLRISISTSGTSPALAKNIRKSLQNQFGQEYADLTELLSRMRQIALSTIKNDKKRKNVLTSFAENEYLEMIKQEGKKVVEEKMRKIISEISNED